LVIRSVNAERKNTGSKTNRVDVFLLSKQWLNYLCRCWILSVYGVCFVQKNKRKGKRKNKGPLFLATGK